ncbi:MAG: helix-turn-helix domain-containing protein [Anaerolineae bacterium]|nr:helix-turn-helix domain-containing protein [Anaerolineae bacterium]MDQ7037088.1 helix-turn-helix domain-containing protein [Anaerolineae bacterium]
MPTYINIEPALLRWQAKHGKRMTNEELANRAGISIAALYRMKSGEMSRPDLSKINELCKVLECEPGEIIKRENTQPLTLKGNFQDFPDFTADEDATQNP